MSIPTESICKGCGKKIVWGLTPEGKSIPLDPTPRVYEIDPGAEPIDGKHNVVHLPNAAVTHFATCSQANRFSGRNRPAAGRLDG